MDCSIRKSAGQCLLTTHRSLSQLTTSFFGSQCQGIRPALFLALPFVFPEFSLKIHCSFIYPTWFLLFRFQLTESYLFWLTSVYYKTKNYFFKKIVSFHLIVFPHIFWYSIFKILLLPYHFSKINNFNIITQFTIFKPYWFNTNHNPSNLITYHLILFLIEKLSILFQEQKLTDNLFLIY